MMDNVEKVLFVFLKCVSPRKILAEDFLSADIKLEEFVQLMRQHIKEYSETELKNLYYYLIHKFKEQFYESEKKEDKLDLFDLLRHYSDWILIEQENEIVCEYRKFLHWRKITNELSEDIFTTSFLAVRMIRNVSEPVRLNWKSVITHNNWELHKILGQGMAENHAHLKGSSTVFPLTWISLMNNIYADRVYRQISEISQNRRSTGNSLANDGETLSVQLVRAACIRFILFKLICRMIWKSEISEDVKEYGLCLENADDLMSIRTALSGSICSEQNIFTGRILPDYAISGVLKEEIGESDHTLIFQGERWLLYHFFYAIYSGMELKKYRELFYTYLVLKETFRAEFVQNNQHVGFENFRIYEKRKDVFLENSFFKREMVRKAIEAGLVNSKVMIMETRIAPKESAKEYDKYIRQMDEWIDYKREYRDRFFYTIHFIKNEDDIQDYKYITCRHSRKRREYIKQAFALVEFRERYPDAAIRVRGIDAANMEIGCGPEVFAQVFRYLADHRIVSEEKSKNKIPQLKRTYHVGEDFLDLVSGLRAIDEALTFLGLKCGDRLGHAMALGIDPEDWYQSKNDRILLSQQEYLDNIVWMYHWIVDCQLDNSKNILNFLIREYEYYFQLIYRNAMDAEVLDHIRRKARDYYKDTEIEKYYYNGEYEFTIEKYYKAWELRGDNPALYEEGFFRKNNGLKSDGSSFSDYAVREKRAKKQNKRYIQDIALLYYYYHFNADVRREGGRTIEVRINRMYIDCVKLLQYKLQKKIAEYGIGIETNPSSNVLIGTFKRYDKHPIINFYNKGLTEDAEQLNRCPQINVSINTDDAGIFGTSLENEYAYMALALEKARDKDGNKLYKRRNIYDWLDHIRVMGLRQTFLDDEEMKMAMRKWEI